MKVPGVLRRARLFSQMADWRQPRGPRADPLGVPARWLIEPGNLADRDVCLLVSWASQPQLAEHAVFLAGALEIQGFAVIWSPQATAFIILTQARILIFVKAYF